MLANKAQQIAVYSPDGFLSAIKTWRLISLAALRQYLLPFRRAVQDFISAVQPKPRRDREWVEIPLYGFLTRNYIDFASGRTEGSKRSELPDGSLIVQFCDGSLIVQTSKGHLVEFDKRARVVLVKVTKEEAQAARSFLRKSDLSEAFRVRNTGDNENLICLPGNILVTESQFEISVRMPNGVDFTRRR